MLCFQVQLSLAHENTYGNDALSSAKQTGDPNRQGGQKKF